jgi:hypothetical protein
MNKKYEEPDKFVRKKVRKPRKPMTEEQKAAAVERLAKARAAKGPAKNLAVHESIRGLPDDHWISPTKVKQWLKFNKTLLSSIKRQADSKDKSDRIQYQRIDTYVKNLQSYLSTGIWSDMNYGERMEFKTKWLVTALAYNEDGTIKRTLGHIYPDIGLYTGEDWCN